MDSAQASQLTSRNLFDCIFRDIPVNVVLDLGPLTVREEIAQLAESMSSSSCMNNLTPGGAAASSSHAAGREWKDDELDAEEVESSIYHGEKNIASAPVVSASAAVHALGISSMAAMPIAQRQQLSHEYRTHPAHVDSKSESEHRYTSPSGPASLNEKEPTNAHDALAQTSVEHDSSATSSSLLPSALADEKRAILSAATGFGGGGVQLTLHLDKEDVAVQLARRYAADVELSDVEDGKDAEQQQQQLQMQNETSHGDTDGTSSVSRKRVHSSQAPSQQQQQQQGALHASSCNNAVAGLANTSAAGQRPELTAEQQLACMPPGRSDRLYEGACQMYRHNKGFGFISPDLGGPDIYFVRDDVTPTFTRIALILYYRSKGQAIPESLQALAQVVPETSTSTFLAQQPSPVGRPTDGTGGASKVSCTATHVTNKPIASADIDVATASTATGANAAATSTMTMTVNGQTFLTVTAAEMTLATRAAQLLQRAAAHVVPLLQSFADCGTVVTFPHDRVSFTTQHNRVDRNCTRLLRAGRVRGVAEQGYALSTEQSWFAPLFASRHDEHTREHPNINNIRATNNDNDTHGHAKNTAMEKESAMLIRFTGTVQACMEDDQRGYIQPDTAMEQGDVMFYFSAFLWSAQVPASQRTIVPRMRVMFSLNAPHAHSKRSLATLVTSVHNTPFDLTNVVLASSEGHVRGQASQGVLGGMTRKRAMAMPNHTTCMGGDERVGRISSNYNNYIIHGNNNVLTASNDGLPPGYGVSGEHDERLVGMLHGAHTKRVHEEEEVNDEVLLFEEDGYAMI